MSLAEAFNNIIVLKSKKQRRQERQELKAKHIVTTLQLRGVERRERELQAELDKLAKRIAAC